MNICLIFLLKFLYFYFPTFCEPCSHKHLAYPSRPYALSMKLTEATQHIMMKSWPCAWGRFSHRASRFSSVSLGVFSWLSDDFARRNAWETPTETPTETLEKRLALRRPLYMVVLTNHGRFYGHHTCCWGARLVPLWLCLLQGRFSIFFKIGWYPYSLIITQRSTRIRMY